MNSPTVTPPTNGSFLRKRTAAILTCLVIGFLAPAAAHAVVVSNLRVTATGDHGAILEWETDVPDKMQIVFHPEGVIFDAIAQEAKAVTQHKMYLNLGYSTIDYHIEDSV